MQNAGEQCGQIGEIEENTVYPFPGVTYGSAVIAEVVGGCSLVRNRTEEGVRRSGESEAVWLLLASLPVNASWERP